MTAKRMRVVRVRYQNERGRTMLKHIYWCEGCDGLHSLAIWPSRLENGSTWHHSGTLDEPTYRPAQLFVRPNGIVCHTEIERGMVEFLADCTHGLRGTKRLPFLPDWATGVFDGPV